VRFGIHASRQVLDQLDRLIAGDLTVEFDPGTELGRKLARLVEIRRDEARERLDDIVEYSTSNMNSTIRAARIFDNVRETDEHAQGIAAASNEMLASVEQISDQARSAAGEAREARIGVTQGMSNGHAVKETISGMTRSIRDTSERISQLARSSREIGTIVDTIADIAKKTNLLALNATIEAARAGEAGRGFAVVAGEVKALSDQTAQATSSIRSSITELQDEMLTTAAMMETSCEEVSLGEQSINALSHSMTIVDQQVQIIDERMNSIAEILDEQNQAAAEVAAAIGQIARRTSDNTLGVTGLVDDMDTLQDNLSETMQRFGAVNLPGKVIKLAKADHVAWKKQLIDMAVGRTRLRSDELADHRSCRLGKWYYSDESADWRSLPEFRQMESHHEKIHDSGKRAARSFAEGDLSTALDYIAQVEEESAEVLRCLDILDHKMLG